MRLNKKGLTLTELIVSFAIVAVAVVYFYQTLYTVRKLYTTAQTETQEFVDKTYAIKMVDSYYDKLKENGTISDDNLKQACSTFNLKYLDKDECTSISAGDVEGEPNLKKITIKWGNNSSDPSVVFHKSLVSASPSGPGENPSGPGGGGSNTVKSILAKPSDIRENYFTPSTNNLAFGSKNVSKLTVGKIETIRFAKTKDKPEGYDDKNFWDASFNKDKSVIAWYKINDHGLYDLVIGGNEKVYFPADSSYLFASFKKLKSIDFENVDTSEVTNMGNMFYWDESLEYLDVSNFNVENVSNAVYMFVGCTGLRRLNLNTLDFGSAFNRPIPYPYGIFNMLNSLEYLNISGMEIDNCDDVHPSKYSFQKCISNQDKNDIFLNVPTSCEIIVKDYSTMNNVLSYNNFRNVKIAP